LLFFGRNIEAGKTLVGSPELHACIDTLMSYFLERPTRTFDLSGRDITALFLLVAFPNDGGVKRRGFMNTARDFTKKFEKMVRIVSDEESLVCNKKTQQQITDEFEPLYNRMREDFHDWMQDERVALLLDQLRIFEGAEASMEFEEMGTPERELLARNVKRIRAALENMFMATPIYFISKDLSAKLIPIIKDMLKDLPAKIEQMRERDVNVAELEAREVELKALEAREAELKARLDYCELLNA
jgi:hypothetical protein